MHASVEDERVRDRGTGVVARANGPSDGANLRPTRFAPCGRLFCFGCVSLWDEKKNELQVTSTGEKVCTSGNRHAVEALSPCRPRFPLRADGAAEERARNNTTESVTAVKFGCSRRYNEKPQPKTSNTT